MKKALGIYGAMLVVAVAAYAAKSKSEQVSSSDMQKIQSLANKEEQAWNSKDARAAASIYTDDATLMTPDGQRAEGRAQIQQRLQRDFSGPMKDAQTKFTVISAQRIGPNQILVDVRQDVTGVKMEQMQQPGMGGAGGMGSSGQMNKQRDTGGSSQMGMPEEHMPKGQSQGTGGSMGQGQMGGGQPGMGAQQPSTQSNHAVVVLQQQGNELKVAAVRVYPEPGTGGAGCPGRQMREPSTQQPSMPTAPGEMQQ